jgi:hypothetical protein
MLWKYAMVYLCVAFLCSEGYGQMPLPVIEYQVQNVQNVETTWVPLTRVTNYQVVVPVVKVIPVTYQYVQPYNMYYQYPAPTVHGRCCLNNNYYIPYYHYKY